jgi:hypothetical protein
MTQVEQRRGFYQITTDAGATAKLTRVTTSLDWVLGDGKSAMAYYGGKQFAKWLGDAPEAWMEHYEAWKASDFDPNKTMRRRGDEGTASHKLFESLLEGRVTSYLSGDEYWIDDGEMRLIAAGYDRGVVELYRHIYEPVVATGRIPVETEKRLYWTEHPIDDCTEHDKQGRCTHGFSGTCDVFFPNHMEIDDLKTHIPGYRFSEWMQMAMYSLAAEQMGSPKITKQRIVIAHDTPDEETGLYYEVQDDRFLPSEAALPFWELYKMRKAWGPKS